MEDNQHCWESVPDGVVRCSKCRVLESDVGSYLESPYCGKVDYSNSAREQLLKTISTVGREEVLRRLAWSYDGKVYDGNIDEAEKLLERLLQEKTS